MNSYGSFKQDKINKQNTKNRVNVNQPQFNPTVSATGEKEVTSFNKNLDKWIDYVSWCRFFPDLWYDSITPKTGGIRLDLDQRVYLRSTARFAMNYMVFPRGYGKCVKNDTVLYTSEGMKEIGTFFNYDQSDKERFIKSNIELVNRYGNLEKTNAGVYSGKKKTKIVRTEEGYEIEPSLNHPLLVFTEKGKLEWKKTEDIQVGDHLPIARKIDVWGNKTKLDIDMNKFLNTLSSSSRPKVLTSICEIPSELTEELALIIGYLIGDGGLTRNNRIGFSNIDQDILKNFISYFEEKLKIKVVKKNEIDYEICGMYVRELFNQVGLKISDAFTKTVPNCIMQAPKKIVAKFVQGLFDTDGGISGSYIQYCTASEKMSKQIQSILLNFGIVSTRKKKYNKKFKNYSYRITIYSKNMDIYLREIGFSCKRKQEKLVELCNKKRNVNKDIIPFQCENVKQLYQEIKKYNPYLYDKLYHIFKGNNELTYEKLDMLMSCKEIENSSLFQHFEGLQENYYFFSPVNHIEDSEAHVYDLSLPDTNSFVSNGFISHNTMLEVMSMIHTAIFFPDIEITMTAQTLQNAAKLIDEKWREILRFYPLLENEVVKDNLSVDRIEIEFTSGGRIDVMANAQSSKGGRRKRINVEESALLNNALFEDVLEPIVNIPRRTIGPQALVNPVEMNGQINFMTTAGFRGSSEFERNIQMVKDMANLEGGNMVLGSDWQLAVNYGRGEPKAKLLEKKDRSSPIFFAMNYESAWVGAADGAVVSINNLIDLRTLEIPELRSDGKSEYILSVDVARSNSKGSNKTIIAPLKIRRNKDGRVTQISLVNLISIPNGLNFTGQSIEIKRAQKLYKAKTVVVDTNGLGVGLVDALLKDTTDPNTGESLGCWDTINTEDEPDEIGSEKIVYALKAMGTLNHDMIVNFMDMVESEKLQLIIQKTETNYHMDSNEVESQLLPYRQTDLLIEEVANLKLKPNNNNTYTVEQLTKKVDKDRYSALVMGLWYIKNFEDKLKEKKAYDPNGFFFMKKPKVY